jgi:hypothetical protein
LINPNAFFIGKLNLHGLDNNGRFQPAFPINLRVSLQDLLLIQSLRHGVLSLLLGSGSV